METSNEPTREQLLVRLDEEKARAERWKECAKHRISAPKGKDGERLFLGQKVEANGMPGWIVSIHLWADLPHQVVVKRRNGLMGTWDADTVTHAPETVEDVLFDLLEQAENEEDREGLVEAFSQRLKLVD